MSLSNTNQTNPPVLLCHHIFMDDACFRLFDEACDQLNMTSLVAFLSELCNASRQQLRTYSSTPSAAGSGSTGTVPVSTLHLYRLGDVVLRCVHNPAQRPLMHVMRLWSVVSVHLVEVSFTLTAIIIKPRGRGLNIAFLLCPILYHVL